MLFHSNEKENDELNELRSKINSLEMEKAQRINEREKFEKVTRSLGDTLWVCLLGQL